MATPSKRVTKNLLLILPLLILCTAAAILVPTLFGDEPPLGTTAAGTTAAMGTTTVPSTTTVTATTAAATTVVTTTAVTSAPVTTTAPTTTTAPPTPTVPPIPSPTPTSYTVTFSVDGVVTTKTVDTDARPAPLPPTPEKAGYTFLGWWYDDGYVTRPYHGEIIETDCRLTARFAAVAHTVSFALGEAASASFTEAKIEHGYAVTDLPRVYKPNHKVDGWYLDAARTIPYNGEPITADTTLYPLYTDYVMNAETAIPKLYITTEGGAPITSKDDYIRATVTLDGATVGDTLSGAGARIRGRGNSTWRFFDKKPYRLKLDSAADLLGLGKDKDFVLLANAGDPTMLHNYTFFGLAALLGDTVTSKCTFVSLYLNGEYRGMYLLCEQCEVGDNRVPIDEGESGLADVGYLIEFGGNTQDPPKYSFTLSTVRDASGVTHAWRQGFYATVKSPDEDTITDAQKQYIKGYVNRVNAAIFTGDYEAFSELCDVESFVRAFIVNMVMRNNDMDYSMYLYKPAGGKLTYGPLWDCDQSAGTSKKSGTSAEGLEVSRYEHWLTALYKMPQFAKLCRDMWNAHCGEIEEYIYGLYDVFLLLEDDINANYTCHDVLGLPYWRINDEHLGYTTYEEHLDFYLDWLDRRIIWLDDKLNE